MAMTPTEKLVHNERTKLTFRFLTNTGLILALIGTGAIGTSLLAGLPVQWWLCLIVFVLGVGMIILGVRWLNRLV